MLGTTLELRVNTVTNSWERVSLKLVRRSPTVSINLSKVVLIAGRKRSGKDTFAKCLKHSYAEAGQSVAILSFADPLKDIMSITLGMTHAQLDTAKNSNPTYRGYLQRFGTEAMKKYFGDAVWVDIMRKRIADHSSTDVILIPDFRFPIEALEGALTVKVTRSSQKPQTDPHASETALESYLFNKVISNDGTIEDLQDLSNNLIKDT